MKYEETFEGQFAELSHKITYRDMLNFMVMSGDKNKLHTDNVYAQENGFSGVVVYGMLTASFISAVIGNLLPGDGALWQGQSMKFIRPVKVGDEITVRVEIKFKHDNEKVLVMTTDVFNQDREAVIYGTASVKMLE